MFLVNDDLSIYATRGDIVCLNVSATDDRTGLPYEFQPGDILQMKVYVKKDAESVVLQKDFPVPAKTNTVGVFLTEQDTRIGDVISKPTDYWYEVTLNPYTNPQTFIGYDEDGAKIFKLFPEGKDIESDEEEIAPEDIPVVDTDLSLLSSRPVENKAISRAITLLKNDLTMVDERLTGKIKANQKSGEVIAEELAVERARIDNLVASPTPGDSELVDIRVGADGNTYESAGAAVRAQTGTMMSNLMSVHFERMMTPDTYTDNVALDEHGVQQEHDQTEGHATCKIPVRSGTCVSVIGEHINRLCLYDEDDEAIPESIMSFDTPGKTITVHQDGYLRFTIVTTKGDALYQAKEDVSVCVSPVNRNNALTPRVFGSAYLYEPKYNVEMAENSVVGHDGAITSNGDYRITDYIPVEPLDVLSIYHAPTYAGAFYDAEKNWLLSIQSGVNGISPLTVKVPYNAVYARFNIKKALADKYSVVYGKEAEETPGSGLVDMNFLRTRSVSEWEGKTFCTFGDSITWQDGKAYGQGDVGAIARGYQTILKEKLAFAAYDNYGESGKPVANGSSNGDGTVTAAQKVEYSEYDLCIIAGGTNDFRLNVPLGELGVVGDTDFDDTTFYGAYRKMVEYILTQKPTIRICLFTPLHRNNSGYGMNTVNQAGHKLIDYVNAIREIGEMYSLPVCDMYANSGINTLNLSIYTMDGLHPNDVGYERMGAYCSAFLKTI